ncbi:hypothetical protein CEXT_565911 [Caerostris extrusa]|uniref:Uncharacterized protein n=1 Tax=Caerostris extrusa TaxID=172846 RepID=A0AAV4PCM0_CAEEX|nr:hypothetical protein CEXT_565911 [Caerostris extrusa]
MVSVIDAGSVNTNCAKETTPSILGTIISAITTTETKRKELTVNTEATNSAINKLELASISSDANESLKSTSTFPSGISKLTTISINTNALEVKTPNIENDAPELIKSENIKSIATQTGIANAKSEVKLCCSENAKSDEVTNLCCTQSKKSEENMCCSKNTKSKTDTPSVTTAVTIGLTTRKSTTGMLGILTSAITTVGTTTAKVKSAHWKKTTSDITTIGIRTTNTKEKIAVVRM